MQPRAYLRDYVFTGMDPAEELLLGPAYSIVKLLQRNNLTIDDIGVWEIHEAFAGQVSDCCLIFEFICFSFVFLYFFSVVSHSNCFYYKK